MGRAWDNSAIHRRLLPGVSETLDWRDLQPFGGQRCERWVCSFQRLPPFGRSSQHCLLGEERTSMTQFSTVTSFTVAPWMLGSPPCISFAWDWSYTPCVATARDDRTPSARLLDETPEIIHAHSGQWLDEMCTLCSRLSLAQAPCTHRQVQVQRKTLRERARCPQRWGLALRRTTRLSLCSLLHATAVQKGVAATSLLLAQQKGCDAATSVLLATAVQKGVTPQRLCCSQQQSKRV